MANFNIQVNLHPYSMPQSVIVIDDEIEILTLFKNFLQNMGLKVTAFTDPLAALEYFNKNPDNYSMIITDLWMPSLCGIDLINCIRKTNTKIKVIIITAFESHHLEDQIKYKQAKVDKLIQKPIRLSQFKRIVNNLL